MSDVIVVGGGVVGTAIAFGLLSRGVSVTVLDAGDSDFTASRGNFGLVWAQGKGLTSAPYAELSLAACEQWQAFAQVLQERTDIDIQHCRPGGVSLCFSDDEVEQRLENYTRLQQLSPGIEKHFQFDLLTNGELQKLLPGISSQIPAGTYSTVDGHCNPLYLLRALHKAILLQGGNYRSNEAVIRIQPQQTGFVVDTAKHRYEADKVVVAAGLGAEKLAPMIGLQGHVKPIRGQVLVTERVEPRLKVPTIYARQTGDGTILLGDSQEDVGFNTGTSQAVMANIAARAVKTFPFLAKVKLVRAWGALRVMSPDGLPLYQQSAQHSGAFIVNCHSGITLAAYHANGLAAAIKDGVLPANLSCFSGERFCA